METNTNQDNIGNWNKVKVFLNSTFAAWFFPSVIILGLGIWIKQCNNDTIKKDLSVQIINEINTRIKFAKELNAQCKEAVKIKNTDSDVSNKYTQIFENILLPFPTYDDIDSIEYSPSFRNESMINLIYRLKSLDNKYQNKTENALYIINKIKNYYKCNWVININNYYYLENLIIDSLNEIK
jgi:hypothetical protein